MYSITMPTSEQATSEQLEIHESEDKDDHKYRRACFTCHLWPVEPTFSSKLGYLAYAHEIAPTTGKDHWQGYAYSKQMITFTVWKKLFPGAHIEQMRSIFAKNEKYCSKEGQLIEHGTAVTHRRVDSGILQILKIYFAFKI